MSKTITVTYYNGNNIDVPSGMFVWQGICRNFDNKLVIVGTTNPKATTGQGVVYIGNKDFTKYKAYVLQVPNAEFTSVYGCRFLRMDKTNTPIYRFVGSYNNFNDTNTYAFIYEGTLANFSVVKNWTLKLSYSTLNLPITFAHSTDGDLIVGNSGNKDTNEYVAWIYNVRLNKFYFFKYPNSINTTLYGIVQNSETAYTICGGFTSKEDKNVAGFVSDIMYEPASGKITPSLQSFTSLGTRQVKHFEGISKTINKDGYTLAANGIGLYNENTAFTLRCRRSPKADKFNFFELVALKYDDNGVTSSNSIQNQVAVGLYLGKDDTHVAWSAKLDNF